MKQAKLIRITEVPTRGWKPDRGWQVRTRSRGGAEGKQKFETYVLAKDAARQMRATGQFREIWVEEVQVVTRVWRDLEPKERRMFDEGRKHVVETQEDD